MGRLTKSKPLYIKYTVTPISRNIKGLYDINERNEKKITTFLDSLINDTITPLLNTSNETAFNFEFPDFNDTLFKLDIIKNYDTLYNITKKSLEMIFKTKQIADDVNNLRNQIVAIEEERRYLENKEEDGDDFVMEVELKNEVSVDLDRVYILYQFYFGYPENGIFDTEKLKIIMDSLREAEALQEPDVN